MKVKKIFRKVWENEGSSLEVHHDNDKDETTLLLETEFEQTATFDFRGNQVQEIAGTLLGLDAARLVKVTEHPNYPNHITFTIKEDPFQETWALIQSGKIWLDARPESPKEILWQYYCLTMAQAELERRSKNAGV